MKQKRTEITIETERVLVVSRPSRVSPWCAACGAQTEMATVDEAAILARVNSRTIYRRAEAGKLHVTETPEGLLLICSNSLKEEEKSL
ncbi:MAG: hypothetical protein ACR2HX_20855 [Pyrinomonadaceae bacterium]